MALKFNPATGKTEDDGTGSGPGLYDQVAGVLTTIAPPLGTAMQMAPAALEEGTPPLPELPATPPATPPPSAPSPAAPPATATPPAAPAVPPPAATPTMTKESTTSTTVSPTGGNAAAMKTADKEVAAADAQGAKTLELEAKNRTKQAEIDQAKLDIEHTLEKQRARNAAVADREYSKRYREIEAQAKQDQDAFKAAAAAGDKGFWGDPSVPTKNQWALSLMFGNIAVAFGGKNVGQELLDKNMSQWTAERDKKLARLERQADKSGGLVQTFWREHEAEYKAHKTLQDAAAYETVADKIDAMNAKMRGLIPEQAAAENAKKAADYRRTAAEKRQAVVDARASRFANTQTTVSTEQTGGAKTQAQLDKDRAETLLDLQGNVVGKALSPVEGAKIRDGQSATNALVDVITKLKGFNASKGTLPGSTVASKVGIETTDFKNRDTLMTQAAGYMTKMYETGVLNEGEYRRYVAILKPSLFQGAKGANESLDIIADGAVNGYNRKLGSQWVKPAGGSSPAAAAPSGLPPGAVEGTHKGRRGYRLGDMFYATE